MDEFCTAKVLYSDRLIIHIERNGTTDSVTPGTLVQVEYENDHRTGRILQILRRPSHDIAEFSGWVSFI
ncbi:MAG: hypothetical protein GY835_09970 [bacterium]|nr:hypothetical protein [bacterium]